MSDQIALFGTIEAASPPKRERIISMLKDVRSFVTTPRAKCTSWSYFTPSTRPKAPSQWVSAGQRENLVCCLEIYTEKAALQTQFEDPAFKKWQDTLKNESLLASDKEEGLVAWYLAGGFASRGESAKPFGQGTVVCTAKFICKDGQRAQMLENLNKYTQWVKDNEPGVLTYCVLHRPKKAPNEVLMFERYKDLKAFGDHGSTKEFKAMFKSIAPYIEVKKTTIQEWSELDISFVGNVVGGVDSKSKL